VGWLALVVLLAASVPLFVCLPLWSDVTHYDVCAWNVLHGGVHYRDVGDINLPGMVWVHLALRSLVGWRSEPLRFMDLLVVAAIIGLLVGWLRRLGKGAAVRVWAAVFLFAFYLSTTEWTHCQRDTWMLLPSLGALSLRRRQVERLLGGAGPRWRLGLWAAAEGGLWALGFWVKPFVAVPGLLVWLTSAVAVWRARAPQRLSRLAGDAAGMLAGGGLVGVAGVAWLVGSGAWPFMWHVFGTTNVEYSQAMARASAVRRTVQVCFKFWPWGLVHFPALLLTAVVLFQLFLARVGSLPAETYRRVARGALFVTFYLGWFLQSTYIQLFHDYVMAPAVLLAVTVVAGFGWMLAPFLMRAAVVGVFGLFVFLGQPLLQWERLSLWGRCCLEGSTPEVRDQLTLELMKGRISPVFMANWEQLQPVREFLRQQHLGNGELTVFNVSAISLYLDLGIRPSTPTLHFDFVFPGDVLPLRERLNASPQRFVVADLAAVMNVSDKDLEPGTEAAPALPSRFPQEFRAYFPWSEPPVFRHGRYVVFRVTGPVAALPTGVEQRTRHGRERDKQ
jgi:hypothetical protein